MGGPFFGFGAILLAHLLRQWVHFVSDKGAALLCGAPVAGHFPEW
jgi:hypothetical protein